MPKTKRELEISKERPVEVVLAIQGVKMGLLGSNCPHGATRESQKGFS